MTLLCINKTKKKGGISFMKDLTGKEEFIEFLRTHRLRLSSGKQVPTLFLTIQDVAFLFDVDAKQIEKLFRSKGFPVCTLGKRKVVEIHAFFKFWQVHPEIVTGHVYF